MSNLVLGYPNQVDATYYPVAFSGGSWQASLPLTNLRDPRLARVARSTNAALSSTQFQVDLGISRPLRLFGIPKCNLSRNAKIRVRGSNTAGDFTTAPVYDTGWLDVWVIIYGQGSLPWGSPSWWDGKLAAEEAVDYDVAYIHVTTAEQTARYWLWEIDDTGNAAGYAELARLFMAPGWQPTVNMRYGAELGVETDTHVERSLGGVDYYDRHRPRRTVDLAFGHLPESEALSQAFEVQRRNGLDRQVFFVWDPADVANLHRRSFLATLRELTPLEFTRRGLANTAFRLQEVL